jgi:hypothetical protein
MNKNFIDWPLEQEEYQEKTFKKGSLLLSYIASRTSVRNHKALFGSHLSVKTTREQVSSTLRLYWEAEGLLGYYPYHVLCQGELFDLTQEKYLSNKGIYHLIDKHLEGIPQTDTSRNLEYSDANFPLVLNSVQAATSTYRYGFHATGREVLGYYPHVPLRHGRHAGQPEAGAGEGDLPPAHD